MHGVDNSKLDLKKVGFKKESRKSFGLWQRHFKINNENKDTFCLRTQWKHVGGGSGGTVPLILNIKRSQGFPLTPKKLSPCHSPNRLLRGLQGRSWHFASTQKLLLSYIKLQFPGRPRRSLITIQSLYNHYTITIQSLYNHYTISLYNHYTITIQSHYTITIQSLYNHYTITIQTTPNYNVTVIQSLVLVTQQLQYVCCRYAGIAIPNDRPQHNNTTTLCRITIEHTRTRQSI